jgi:hypothetical protein
MDFDSEDGTWPVYLVVETLGDTEEDAALGEALATFVAHLAQLNCVSLQRTLAQRRIDEMHKTATFSPTVNVTSVAAAFSIDRCKGSVSWLTDTMTLHVVTRRTEDAGARDVPEGASLLAHVAVVPANVDEVALRRIVGLLKGNTDRLLLLYATQLTQHLFTQSSRVSRAACVPGGGREMAAALGAGDLIAWAAHAPDATSTSPAAHAVLSQLPGSLLPPDFRVLYDVSTATG